MEDLVWWADGVCAVWRAVSGEAVRAGSSIIIQAAQRTREGKRLADNDVSIHRGRGGGGGGPDGRTGVLCCVCCVLVCVACVCSEHRAESGEHPQTDRDDSLCRLYAVVVCQVV